MSIQYPIRKTAANEAQVLHLPLRADALVKIRNPFPAPFKINAGQLCKLKQIIHHHNTKHDHAEPLSKLHIITVNQSHHLAMQEGDNDNCIKPPCDGAFQADQPLEITWLICIVPPYFTENLKHQLQSTIFECSSL